MIMPEDIYVRIPTAALYEQLAEECSELAHAALKMARVVRKENPTPVTMNDAIKNVNEEYTDLKLVADVIGLYAHDHILQQKIERWYKRIEESKNG